MAVVADYIAAPLRALEPLTARRLLDARREVEPSGSASWVEEWNDAHGMARSWWAGFEVALDESWARDRELGGRGDEAFATACEVLARLPEDVWAHGLRPPQHAEQGFRLELICDDDDCGGAVRPTGTRGPLPRRCPACHERRARERARARVRKHRGPGHVLARFESRQNADGELREHTIVDLDLKLERPSDDEAGRWLDERATWWLMNAKASPGWRAFAALEDAAMAAAAAP